ncbi:MAG: EF-P lysine aminoacylase GenX [Methylobacteriaceae bacterium]|nr:EF-P lysine aminoacylase GenX [Methylobacteriaceae bacterium]
MIDSSPWWTPLSHADRRLFLLSRNRIAAAVRAYFDSRGFVEVDPCVLQTSPGNETHLHAFATTLTTADGRSAGLHLHTSPEFACKKLLAAGERRLFTLSHAFRNRERDALHHPEFTMLEWYRADEPYTTLMEDCIGLARLAADAAGTGELVFRGVRINPFAVPEHLSVADAFKRYARIDLLSTIDDNGETDAGKLRSLLAAKGIRTADDDTWSDMFSRVLVEKIEPHLGMECLTILDRYPVAEAALARPCPYSRREAERFELFACGVELANGFGELTDADEQRRRFTLEMAEKQRIYGESLPLDEEFLAALRLMPEASGAAMGFDRLVMLATHAPRIDLTLWAPVPEVPA